MRTQRYLRTSKLFLLVYLEKCFLFSKSQKLTCSKQLTVSMFGNMAPTCSMTVFSHHWGPIRVMAAMILA